MVDASGEVRADGSDREEKLLGFFADGGRERDEEGDDEGDRGDADDDDDDDENEDEEEHTAVKHEGKGDVWGNGIERERGDRDDGEGNEEEKEGDDDGDAIEGELLGEFEEGGVSENADAG